MLQRGTIGGTLNKSNYKPYLLHLTLLGYAFASLVACGGQPDLAKTILQSTQSSLTTGSSDPDLSPTPNGKVFRKNPSFGATTAVAYSYTYSAASDTYTFTPATTINFDAALVDVVISGYRNNFLENADIQVLTDAASADGTLLTSTLARARPDPLGRWNFSSVGDSSRRLGQLMAYYWINNMKEVANRNLAGSWHPTGADIGVYSHCYDINGAFAKATGLGPNAFWSSVDNVVCMSFSGPFEASHDASVYDHEMGHANIDYGTNGQITEGVYAANCTANGQTFECCATADGCAGAINEGQADVHSYIVFNSPRIGEYFLNSPNGIRSRAADLNSTLTTTQKFADGSFGKEIHNFGGVWGAAWWTLRQSLGSPITDKIFFAHLELLTGNDTFRTALNQILAADQQLVTRGIFTANHRTQILAAFSRHGITPP
jgi:hypothetical protein